MNNGNFENLKKELGLENMRELEKSERLKEYEKVNKAEELCCTTFEVEAKKIVDMLKENCKTYGKLIKKIELLKKEALHRSCLKPEGLILINKCEELVKEEMNDLEIIIHS